MGSFWTMLFETLTGWVRGIVSGIWSSFNPGSGGNFFSWLIDHWFVVLIVICVIGAAADLIVYLFRWQPYRVWKRLFHRRKSDEAEKTVYTEDDLVGLPESFDEEEETYAPEEEEPADTGYWTWDNGQNETGNEAGIPVMDRFLSSRSDRPASCRLPSGQSATEGPRPVTAPPRLRRSRQPRGASCVWA